MGDAQDASGSPRGLDAEEWQEQYQCLQRLAMAA